MEENAIFSSFTPTDKIVFTKKDSVSVSSLGTETGFDGGSHRRVVIPHGLTRPVFVDFRYSLNGGTTWETGGGKSKAIGYSTATDIIIVLEYGRTTGTFMYEVVGTWIDNYDATNPLIDPITISGKKFFDSRDNYRKIFKQGFGDATNISSIQDIFTADHTLGRTPKFVTYFEARPNQVWQEMGGGAQNPWYFDFSMSEMASKSTPTQIIADISPPFPYRSTKVYYKVFADG